MAAFFIYILKSSFCLSLFYVLYRMLFSGATYLRFNRKVILCGMVACLLLPLVHLTLDEELPVHRPLRMLDEALTVVSLPEAHPAATETNNAAAGESVSAGRKGVVCFLPIVYGGGCVVVLCWFLLAHIRMWRLIRGAVARKDGAVTYLVTHQRVSPFSWGRYIVVNSDDYAVSPLVCLHERMHVRCRHSHDKLFVQLLLVFHWFNPVAWLWWRELYDLHEYEADQEVLNQGIDAKTYQLLLVEKAVGTRLYSMANGFCHSSLKKRIAMMKKRRTPGWKRLYVFMAIPVAAGVVLVFARPHVDETLQTVVARKVIAAADSNRLDLSASEADYEVFAVNGECVAFDLYIDRHTRILFGTASHMNVVTPENMAGAISRKLIAGFVSCYEQNGGATPEVVVRITADRNAKMGAVFDAKLRVNRAYELALAELAGKYPSETLHRSLASRISYEEPRAYAPEPAGVPDKDRRLEEGLCVTLYAGGKKQAKLDDFTLQELEDALAATTSLPGERIAGIRVSKDTPEGVVYDIKQVLRKYLSKVNVVCGND